MFFGFGRWPWSQGLRQAGKHARVPESRAMPCHKVPALQANGVAARLRPPAEAREARKPGDQFNRWAMLFRPPGLMVAALHQLQA